jgi:hypothetical protein
MRSSSGCCSSSTRWRNEATEPRVTLKPAPEISADSLQSPHDADAAYRKKQDETVRGYSVNLTETCQEALNLIVDVHVEPATAADNGYLQDAVQRSEQVLETTVHEISADGAYYSEANEAYAQEQDKDIHYTGFPGKPGRYDYVRSDDGVVVIERQRREATGRGIQARALSLPRRRQVALHHRQRDRCGRLPAAHGASATRAIQPPLQCRGEHLSALAYHTRKKKLKYRGGNVPFSSGRCAERRGSI